MSIDQYVTVTQAAATFGVSRQRMHALLKTYDVPVEVLPSRMKVIEKRWLIRIPKNRPDGVRLDRRKKTKKTSV